MSHSVSATPNSGRSLPPDLSQLVGAIHSAAQNREGDCLALLELLRLLDRLHYEIRETAFRDALPDNRQRLYRLLRDIEQEGGWPHIKRMKLIALLEHLEESQDAAQPNAEGEFGGERDATVENLTSETGESSTTL